MKARIIFTHVSDNALRGILNLFGTAYVRVEDDGRFTVVVPDENSD